MLLKSSCIFTENGLNICQQNVPSSASLEMSAMSCTCDSPGLYLWPPTQKKPGNCVHYPHIKIWGAVSPLVSLHPYLYFFWKL